MTWFRLRARRGPVASHLIGRPGPPATGGGTPLAAMRALWRHHRLITVAVALSLVPRVLAMLAFRPALFTPDSFAYLAEGAHPNLSQWHPSGYPVFLWLLSPFHSLAPGHRRAAPDGHGHRRPCLRAAAALGAAGLGRHARRLPDADRLPPGGAGVGHPARHRLRAAAHGGGRDRADPPGAGPAAGPVAPAPVRRWPGRCCSARRSCAATGRPRCWRCWPCSWSGGRPAGDGRRDDRVHPATPGLHGPVRREVR